MKARTLIATLAFEAVILATVFYVATLYSPVATDVPPPRSEYSASGAYPLEQTASTSALSPYIGADARVNVAAIFDR